MIEVFKQELLSRMKVDDTLLNKLEEKVKIIDVKKSQYLLRNNEICHYGYFISKGSFMHTHINDEGKEFVIAFHIDDVYRYITSPQSYFSEVPSQSEIVALEDSQVLAFHKNDLMSLSKEDPSFHEFYHNLTTDGFLYLYIFTTMKLSTSPTKLIEKLYNEYPIFNERIPDKYMARFMGISVEWFCKLKKKLLKNASTETKLN